MGLFVGRREELGLLRGLLDKRTASLVVVYGRRRVGKSRLIEEFGRNQKMISIAGLPPQSKTTRDTQLNEFSEQLASQLSMPKKNFSDWIEAFNELATHTRSGRVILFLDEISWIGNCDKDFIGKLKNAWDMQFKKNDALILILCGSLSPLINNDILSNTGFYGRISLKLQLGELSLSDCDAFFNSEGITISAYEKLKLLSVTGGIPKYLEEIKLNLSADENIKQLCFIPSGLLFSDYDYIFSALLQKESKYYQEIILLLREQSLEQTQLIEALNSESGGSISEYLNELVVSGFVSRDYTWHLKNGGMSTLSKYRLSDNYLRFYLKYIYSNIQKIKNGQFKNHSLSALPGWSSIMGLQIENIVINNKNKIKELLKIYPDEVIYDNPYFQRKTVRGKGCQIDYLIQTKFGNLYVCEIKFSRNPIRSDVIESVLKKISRMTIPKNFSVRPILIHTSEISDSVLDSDYFAKIIDLKDLLKGTTP